MTDYPRCATCKWWGDEWNDPTSTVQMCSRLMDEDMGCQLIFSSGGEYSIHTRSDFGCVLHAPKQKEDNDDND